MNKPKILFFDIEASNLNANWGFTFCVGYKFLGDKKVSLMSVRDHKLHKKDPTNDIELLKDFSKVFNTADIVVGWYSSRFDVPFLNTRLMMHGLLPLAKIPHVDGWRIARYQLKLHSNRLDVLSNAIPELLTGRKQKTPLDMQKWSKAIAGDGKCLKVIEDHCIADIGVLEDVYQVIKPHAQNLPHIGKILDISRESCPACDSDNQHKRGYYLTARGRKARYQCQDCGHWYLGKIQKLTT